MIPAVVRSLWDEPRVPDAPLRVWRDWALLAALAITFTCESLLRPDIPWRPVGLVEVVVLGIALWHRRVRPLAMLALGFGTVIVVDLVAQVSGVSGSVAPTSTAFVLVLVYSLVRWGSGREVAAGLPIALTAAAVSLVRDQTDLVESFLGLVVLMAPAAIGATVRFWATSRARELESARLLEREQLARELHDTVAHHVSAMVVRAQAGRVVAATSPAAALEALEIIESEGSRTLAEMRSMVGALRQGDDVAFAPQPGIGDLPALARGDSSARVEVSTSGDLDGVGAAVDAASYRIAQEGVTNALRHSRGAGRILVTVAGGPDTVEISVVDDGEPVPASRTREGFGIVGMTERAALLGGTLSAGPGVERGWVVRARLPRTGVAP